MRLLLALGLMLARLAAAQEPSPSTSGALVVRTVHVCPGGTDARVPPAPSAACRREAIGRVDPQGRTLWILADVMVPPSVAASRVPVGVLMQGMASSAIFWDGLRLGTSGVVSATAAGEVPGQFIHVAPLRADELRPGTHRRAVHLSSHRGPLRVQSPLHVLAVAPLDLIREGVGTGSAATLLAMGALLLAAVYFAAVAGRVAPRQEATLIAALIACALVQGGAELWRTLRPITYVEQIWRLVAILLAATALGAVLVAYCARRFQAAHTARWLAGYVVGALLAWALLPGFDGRTLAVLGVGWVVALVATVRAAWRGTPGARAITAVLLALVVTAAVEVAVFLDRDLFFGLTALTVVLMMDHVTQLRRLRIAADAARQEVERLELELLRQRLTPHWLLNMLNALAAWIEEEPTTAVRMVGMLGEEFHRLAHPVDAPLIPVREELAACERLLELMSLRSGRTFTLEVIGVADGLSVPPGVLHTLVENALTHGRYRHAATFTVRQEAEGGVPVLAFDAPRAEPVDRARAGDPARNPSGDGFGLTYVRARLTAAFGETARLTHGPRKDGGWRTVLRLGRAQA